jgi:hypothetical protein
MGSEPRRVYRWIFILVVAPIGAVVVISALLLFGVKPPIVFAPGRAVKALLEACGLHPANRVAVVSTAIAWWAVIVAAGLAITRSSRRRGATPRSSAPGP